MGVSSRGHGDRRQEIHLGVMHASSSIQRAPLGGVSRIHKFISRGYIVTSVGLEEHRDYSTIRRQRQTSQPPLCIWLYRYSCLV